MAFKKPSIEWNTQMLVGSSKPSEGALKSHHAAHSSSDESWLF
jgi:hypothetical protein